MENDTLDDVQYLFVRSRKLFANVYLDCWEMKGVVIGERWIFERTRHRL